MIPDAPPINFFLNAVSPETIVPDMADKGKKENSAPPLIFNSQ
jgi:hypothetical protein